MGASKPWAVRVQDHPGSTLEEIANEPNWSSGHEHRVGYRNKGSRLPGLTHKHDEYQDEIELSLKEKERLRHDIESGKLVNFRNIIESQEVRCSTGFSVSQHLGLVGS
jgi:nitrate reductase (NAD(P)H)